MLCQKHDLAAAIKCRPQLTIASINATSMNSCNIACFAALSDPECDSDLLLKCSSPEEEDDLLGEMQCRQDIEGIDAIQDRQADSEQPAQDEQVESEQKEVPMKGQEPEKDDDKDQAKATDSIKTLRPPMNVSCSVAELELQNNNNVSHT